MVKFLGFNNSHSIEDFLKAMRAGIPKWVQNSALYGDPRCSKKQRIQRMLELLGVSEGSIFGVISGPPDLVYFPDF